MLLYSIQLLFILKWVAILMPILCISLIVFQSLVSNSLKRI